MRERPILFSGPMVRAILAGRKTQTRRLVQWPLRSASDGAKRRIFTERDVAEVNQLLLERQASPLRRVAYPYGVPGDRLWVRETIRRCPSLGEYDSAVYAADGAPTALDTWPWQRPVLPGIHCPRGLSRITLAVTAVRVERLQDITEADILAEGVTVPLAAEVTNTPWSSIPTLHDAWRLLWDHINGKRCPWASNPWVWAVEFRRVDAGGKGGT